MNPLIISHKRYYNGTILEVSSEQEKNFSSENLLTQDGVWRTKNHSEQKREHCVIAFEEDIWIDYIETTPGADASRFPLSFHFEASLDGIHWSFVHFEENMEIPGGLYQLRIPLLSLRYLRFEIDSHRGEGSFYSEIGRIRCGIGGVVSIEGESADDEHDLTRLLDSNPDTWWKSPARDENSRELIQLDLGRSHLLNGLLLVMSSGAFTDQFMVESSPDGSVWNSLLNVKGGYVPEGRKLYWELPVVPGRFIRIDARNNSGTLELSELYLYAAAMDVSHSHAIGEMTPVASVFQPGIVRLSKDGEETPGTVVQGSDRRLREASTVFKGIMQFAEHGESVQMKAVQSSDPRLQPATDTSAGVTRLGYDRDTSAGVAVQGNDSRLREATEDSYGIVKLCPDGVYSEKGVVTGNDPRLHKAGEDRYGIVTLARDGESKEGAVVQSTDYRLRGASTLHPGVVQLAEDGDSSPEMAVQANDHRLMDATTLQKGIVELAEDGEETAGVAVQGHDRRLKDATTSRKGIVELAEDGEEKESAVVQSTDSRLKDATTSRKGIVELAEDGEEAANAAVQGNDRRLKDATTSRKGIVELAEDGEDAADVAVQGNDRRLKDATTSCKGIVELAEDGEDAADVAVQGNDRRLKDATTSRKGIVELAEDGEDAADVAVQGNDRRLKDATTSRKGIVELAEDGEDAADVAVQGNDRRLKDATTSRKGIVELAEDGEDAANVAVQGNDRRLKKATKEQAGIVQLAGDGQSREGLAVQSHDSRLHDAREPLPHTHPYAHVNHQLNSHEGMLTVDESHSEDFRDFTFPSEAPLVGRNRASEPGAVGVAGITEGGSNQYGLLGHSPHVGVRGQSTADSDAAGCGVMGIGRFVPGGVFASEQGYSLRVEGREMPDSIEPSVKMTGDGLALRVDGETALLGELKFVGNSYDRPGSIVQYLQVVEDEFISQGDVLVISASQDMLLERSHEPYSRAVAGVVASKESIVLNGQKGDGLYPVAMGGVVLCKVDARNRPVHRGDLLVTSDTPGCAMAGTIDSFEKTGTVIGKSMATLEDGINVIPVMLMPQ